MPTQKRLNHLTPNMLTKSQFLRDGADLTARTANYQIDAARTICGRGEGMKLTAEQIEEAAKEIRHCLCGNSMAWSLLSGEEKNRYYAAAEYAAPYVQYTSTPSPRSGADVDGLVARMVKAYSADYNFTAADRTDAERRMSRALNVVLA